MPTSVECPACRYTMVLSDERRTRRVRCMGCGNGFELASPDPDPVAVPPPASGSQAAPSAASGAFAARPAASGAYAAPGMSRSIEAIMEDHLRTIRYDMNSIKILLAFTFFLLALVLVRMTFFGVYARFAASPH